MLKKTNDYMILELFGTKSLLKYTSIYFLNVKYYMPFNINILVSYSQ